jgi:bacillopeptidase F
MSAPTSRLVKRERSKIVKQSTALVALSVGLILLFIFVILPGFISLINTYFSTDPFPQESPILMQAPLLDAPVAATNSAELELTGYAMAGSTISLIQNALESDRTTTTESDGRFSLPISLEEGENTLVVYSSDSDSNQSPNSQELVVIYDKDPPKLVIDEPQPETRFDRKSRVITVKGITDAGSVVYINGRMVQAGQDGAFSSSLSLNDGTNELDITARDRAGNNTNQKVTVYLDV